jgi:NAD(P)-dependent dehydrogenase (short-subunit alcohol dehydrogenase family)
MSAGTFVVTGTSSGIGAATALRLARSGHRVFAGVRRAEDASALVRDGGGNVAPLILDVTDAASIERARATVEEALRPAGVLAGLVNNAGIAVAGPLEILPLAALREQFEINLFGAIAVTQAFLPLLRASRGRIVNVSSISGKAASPYVGAYCASKHALEAASDALRIELRPFGVHVSVIEPGRVRTPIWERSAAASTARLDALPEESIAPYRQALEGMRSFARIAHKTGTPPEAVAAAIEHALTAKHPRARYLVGVDARVQLAIARLPERLRDRIIEAFLAHAARSAPPTPVEG